MTKKKKKKKRLTTILLLLLFLIGLGLFLYPFISKIIISKQVEENIQEYKDDLTRIIKEAEENGDVDFGDDVPRDENGDPAPYEKVRYEDEAEENQPYLNDLYQYMRRRNRELFESGQSQLDSPTAYKYPEFDLHDFGVKTESIGLLQVEKLNLKLPLFLGANDANLTAGCGHLTYTSYPIGDVNTNCVIAVHRGLGGSDFLRHVEKLESGDIIKLQNYWYTMEYRVVSTKIVEPDAVDSILIRPGKDTLTLYTCHPYGINSQRYLVYCERVTSK